MEQSSHVSRSETYQPAVPPRRGPPQGPVPSHSTNLNPSTYTSSVANFQRVASSTSAQAKTAATTAPAGGWRSLYAPAPFPTSPAVATPTHTTPASHRRGGRGWDERSDDDSPAGGVTTAERRSLQGPRPAWTPIHHPAQRLGQRPVASPATPVAGSRSPTRQQHSPQRRHHDSRAHYAGPSPHYPQPARHHQPQPSQQPWAQVRRPDGTTVSQQPRSSAPHSGCVHAPSRFTVFSYTLSRPMAQPQRAPVSRSAGAAQPTQRPTAVGHPPRRTAYPSASSRADGTRVPRSGASSGTYRWKEGGVEYLQT